MHSSHCMMVGFTSIYVCNPYLSPLIFICLPPDNGKLEKNIVEILHAST